MNISQRFLDAIDGVWKREIPDEVMARARRSLLDYLAVTCAGATFQREKLEKQMKSLFELYQSEKIYAKQSGEVTDLNDSFENVGFSESVLGNVSTVKLSNSPTGEDDSGYVNFAVLVTSIDEAELQVKMSANALGDIDLTTVANIGTAICTNAGSISKGVISRVYGYN